MGKNIQIMKFDGKGGAVEIPTEELIQSSGLIWIHVDLAAGKQFFKTFNDLPSLVTDVLLAKVTRPRAMVFNNSLLATFRGLNLKKSGKEEEMASIRLWIQENRIITVQRQRLDLLTEVQTMLQHGAGPKTAADFLETLLYTITDRTALAVSHIDDQLDRLEDQLTELSRLEFSHMRRRIIILRRYLIPQREAILRIPIDKVSWLNDVNLMHLHEISDASTRVLEDLESERERANVIHEELVSLMQDKLNQKMYLLSLVAIIFMPLSFLTGLLGINVAGIPGATFKYGFLSVCGILLFIFVLQLIFLKRKRWL